MFELVNIGIHPDHPSGRYDEKKYSSRRNILMYRSPQILFLEEPTIEWMKKKYNLKPDLIIATENRTAQPILGWKPIIETIKRRFNSKIYILWGAELGLCNYGFNKYQGCVGEVYTELISKGLNAIIQEENCFIIDKRIDWGKLPFSK